MAVKSNTDRIIKQLSAKLNNLRIDSPKVRKAMELIGLNLSNAIKLNVRKKGIIDTGQLINSIKHRVFAKTGSIGVLAGSFGAPHAALNEFGTNNFKDSQRRAMFAALRNRGKLKKDNPGKGVLRGKRWKPRPYMRPAFKEQLPLIRQILRKLTQE